MSFCREICFVAIYALLCGEKLNQRLRMWWKNDKYEVCHNAKKWPLSVHFKLICLCKNCSVRDVLIKVSVFQDIFCLLIIINHFQGGSWGFLQANGPRLWWPTLFWRVYGGGDPPWEGAYYYSPTFFGGNFWPTIWKTSATKAKYLKLLVMSI